MRYYLWYTCLGYTSQNKQVKIPWAKLSQDPDSWIQPECAPDGFEWANPSKIHIGEVFHLLDHWRERQKEHLKPLIWVSTCPPLKGMVWLESPENGEDEESSEEFSDLGCISSSIDPQSTHTDEDKESGTQRDTNHTPDIDDQDIDINSPHSNDESSGV